MLSLLWLHTGFRAWLHGEFQPGLKFQPGQPGWNFVAITWRTSARAESISLGAKYEIALEESQEDQNGEENTNPENRRIASLAVWSFGGA